jgi:hypothetical protein
MTKKFDALNKTFNIESEVVATEIEKVESPEIELKEKEEKIDELLDKDFELIRGVLHSTLSKSQEALDCVLELAQETNSPRAYEVVGMIVKSINDTSNQVMEHHKKKKDLKKDTSDSGPTNITNNALLFCTTAELSKMLKEQLKAPQDDK